jgi:hypothetical protein
LKEFRERKAHRYCNDFEKLFRLGKAPTKALDDKSKVPSGIVKLKIESINTFPLKLLKLQFLDDFPHK